MQTYCASCSAILDIDALFCSRCRAPVTLSTIVNCPNCHKENKRGVNFCKYCAFDLSQAAPSVRRVTTNVTPVVTKELRPVAAATSLSGWARLFRLGSEDGPTITPILVWGIVGSIAGLLSEFSIVIPIFGLNFLPGIVFGIALYLFGEYSHLPSSRKHERMICFITIIVASTVGWYLAYKVHAKPALLAETYLETFLSNMTGSEIRLPDYQEFILSGFIGGSFLALAEIICWKLNYPSWVYAAGVVAVAGLAGLLVMPFVLSIGIFIIWQAAVLTFHAIIWGTSKKQVIPSTILLVLLAGSISGAQVLYRRAMSDRYDKEQAETRLREAEEERQAIDLLRCLESTT